jgi:colanic acid biosynthesis glycosyl transferase WcaI
MRILIVSQYYDPEPVEKVHDLARGLVSIGHDVEVLTGFPCYPLGRIYEGWRQRLWQREVMDGVRVIRVPQIPDHSASVLRRVIYYCSFAFFSAIIGVLLARRPDVVLVYQAAMPVGFAGRFLSLVKRAPYVLDVVDLWPESVSMSGFLRHPVPEAIIRTLMRFIYRGARRINVVTEGFSERLVAAGVASRNLTVIHNWMPSQTYRPVPYDGERAALEGLSGRFNVMYAGNLGALQGLETVVDAAAMLRDVPAVQFVFVGGGTDSEDLALRAARSGLTNVRFLGRRPPASMPGLYAIADVLLVHLKPDPLADISIPSKTFAYLAAGRPVLMAVRGDAAQMVEKYGFGLSVPAGDPPALADAVRRMSSMSQAELDQMAAAAAEAHRTVFCAEVQIKRFDALLRDAVSATA